MSATKKTEARWRAVVREQEASGQGVKEFAEAHGLSAATLYWWRSALAGRTRSKGPRLVEVTLPGILEDRDSLPFELALPGDRRLRISGSFDPESLRRLIGVLEERC